MLFYFADSKAPPRGGDLAAGAGESAESDDDSDEEGYDSDVQREKSIDYMSKIYATAPLRETEGVKPHQQKQQEPDNDRWVIYMYRTNA